MIEFRVDTIDEGDKVWSELVVKTPDKDWHSADLEYGTEDETTIRNIIRNRKYCSEILKNLLEFLKSKGTDLACRKPDYLCDMDSPWGVDFGGVSVISNEDFNKYEVGYETYDSGSYWEPPSSDYVEHSKHKYLSDALFTAYSLILKDEYQTWNESGMEDVYRNELEETN